MSDLQLRIIQDELEFKKLKPLWNELLKKSHDNTIFLTWDWVYTWWKYFGHSDQIHIITVYDGHELISILPTSMKIYDCFFFRIRVLENICSTDTDHGGIISIRNNDEVYGLILNYFNELISEKCYLIRFSHVFQNNDLINILKLNSTDSTSFKVLKTELTSSPYILLPHNWEIYNKRLSKKKRKNLGWSSRALSKNHEIKFELYDAPDDKISETMNLFFKIHKQRWNDKKLTSRFYDNNIVNFYNEITNNFLNNGWMDISLLYVDDEAISIVWAFKYNRVYYYMTPTFDPTKYKKYSVGNMHLSKLIKTNIENNYIKFDFLKGMEPYKLNWTNDYKTNYQLTLFSTFWGQLRLNVLRIFLFYDLNKHRKISESFRLLINKIKQG
jgi:CelD/BcsL family acetyltransferase involved in cellulose biosynthesis